MGYREEYVHAPLAMMLVCDYTRARHLMMSHHPSQCSAAHCCDTNVNCDSLHPKLAVVVNEGYETREGSAHPLIYEPIYSRTSHLLVYKNQEIANQLPAADKRARA